jgi:hypothetical protein
MPYKRTVDRAWMPARRPARRQRPRRVDVYVGVDVRARVFIGRHACLIQRHELLGRHELRLQRLLQLLNSCFDELESRRADAVFIGDARAARM